VIDRQTDRRTDGFAIAYSALSMLSRAKNVRLDSGVMLKDRKMSDDHWSSLHYGQGMRGQVAVIYSVSLKNAAWSFLTFFPDGREFLVQLVLVLLIYARLQIFIQLPAALIKLCHIKHDRRLPSSHHMLKTSTIGRQARLMWLNFITVRDNIIKICSRHS